MKKVAFFKKMSRICEKNIDKTRKIGYNKSSGQDDASCVCSDGQS